MYLYTLILSSITAQNQRPIDLISNHVSVLSDLPNRVFYQYDVAFSPEIELTRTKFKLVAQLQLGKEGSYTFMGTVMYSRMRLDADVSGWLPYYVHTFFCLPVHYEIVSSPESEHGCIKSLNKDDFCCPYGEGWCFRKENVVPKYS